MDNNYNSENEFTYNYDEYKESSNVNENNYNNKKGKLKIIIIIILLFLFLGGLIFLLINILGNNKNNGKISLNVSETLDLFVDDVKKIDVSINGIDNENLNLNYVSENENIATVTNDGMVTGVSDGSTIIVVSFSDENNNIYSKNCIVSVSKKDGEITPQDPKPKPPETPGSDKIGPTINYTLPNNVNGWYKGNVVISLKVNDDYGIKSVKYAVNCSSNCSYKDVTNSNKIALTGSGTKNVVIVATDNNNNETKKKLAVKIDNTDPTTKLSNSVVYDNTGSVQVCVTCTDSQSGCKESKVCQTHTQSVENASLIVYDKVGNSAISDKYKVVIDKEKPTCSLTYSDNKITATTKDTGGSGLSYYGFSEKYTGTKEKEKSSVTAGTYKYYVKDKAGNTSSCSLTCAFTNWMKSGYVAEGNCHAYSQSSAERDGATWYRTCTNGKAQEYVRYFKCS